jgi:fatty acid desaturase
MEYNSNTSDNDNALKHSSDSNSKSKYQDYLSKEEFNQLKASSNTEAATMFLHNWLIIGLCFLILGNTQSVLLMIITLFVLAGRQLGIGILMHECAHRAFFKQKKLNDFMGHWFGGLPLLVPIHFYRPYHLTHHSKTGTKDDPDVKNIEQYPVYKKSFFRKVLRDFSGLSGIKMLYGVIFYVLADRQGDAISMGVQSQNIQGQNPSEKQSTSSGRLGPLAIKNISQALLCQSILFLPFWLLERPELYFFW